MYHDKVKPSVQVEFWQLPVERFYESIWARWHHLPFDPRWPDDYELIAEHVSDNLHSFAHEEQLRQMMVLGQEPETWSERNDFWVYRLPRSVSPTDVIVIDTKPIYVDNYDFVHLS